MTAGGRSDPTGCDGSMAPCHLTLHLKLLLQVCGPILVRNAISPAVFIQLETPVINVVVTPRDPGIIPGSGIWEFLLQA